MGGKNAILAIQNGQQNQMMAQFEVWVYNSMDTFLEIFKI
jgi:hypothetical protein